MQRVAAATLISGMLSLCACQNMPANPVPAGQAVTVANDNALQRHLAFMEKLYQMNTSSLDTTHQQLRADYDDAPNTDNRLRLAWVLATHGHAHSNPWAARRLLSDTLPRLESDSGLARLVRIRIIQLNRTIQLAEEIRKSREKLKALTDIEQSLENRGDSKETP